MLREYAKKRILGKGYAPAFLLSTSRPPVEFLRTLDKESGTGFFDRAGIPQYLSDPPINSGIGGIVKKRIYTESFLSRQKLKIWSEFSHRTFFQIA